MIFIESAIIELKRKWELNVDDLERLFDTESENYKTVWDELKHHIIELNDHARQKISSVSFT